MNKATPYPSFDLRKAIAKNRLIGLWRLMAGFRWVYLAAALTLGIAALSKTGTYLLLRQFADQLVGTTEQKYPLVYIALGFLVLAIFEGGFTFTSGRLAAFTAEGITLRVRNFLFDHLQRLSFAYHAQTQTGELISRSTSDVDALRRFFADQAIGIGRILLLFTVNFTTLVQLEWRLALISILAVPPVFISAIFFFRRVNKAYEAYQEQEARLSTTLQENLTGVRVVKAFARQPFERDKFEQVNWEKFERGRKFTLLHSLFWPTTDILCGLQLVGGYLVAGWFAINGWITIGTYMAYVGLVIWLIWPLRNLGRLVVDISTGLVSYNRVMEIVRQQQEPLEDGSYHPIGNLKGAVTFDQVCFKYEADVQTLTDISFACQPGQAVALLGPTGSGKSSLVNLLPRFYDYISGKILIDGIELKEYTRRYLRSQIGIVEQEPFLFSRTIRENITYGVGRDVSEAEIEAATRAAAVHEVIISFPQGYETLVGEKGITLSGGQKQRVAIARTLLKNPRILILDDSTSSVDTETEASIRDALKLLMQNRTTFIIAHRIQSVMNADQILVLDRGRVVQMGTHAELVNQPGMYRQVYEIQTRIEIELEQELTSNIL